MKQYTLKDWEKDRTFAAAIGQRVSDAVFYEFLNCVPPAYYGGGIMQVGEPASTDKETLKDLFTTFKKSGGSWVYVGLCLYGKTEHRKSYFD